jgi:hypothetical protein
MNDDEIVYQLKVPRLTPVADMDSLIVAIARINAHLCDIHGEPIKWMLRSGPNKPKWPEGRERKQ